MIAGMILVFGGTTEGRKAVEVLEKAGNAYYYSTKTGEQDITLHHGIRLDGALDEEATLRYNEDICQHHYQPLCRSLQYSPASWYHYNPTDRR